MDSEPKKAEIDEEAILMEMEEAERQEIDDRMELEEDDDDEEEKSEEEREVEGARDASTHTSAGAKSHNMKTSLKSFFSIICIYHGVCYCREAL